MGDTRNFILAPGCDMPYHVPVENVIGIAQAVLEPDKVREMLKNYVAQEDDIDIVLPDYEHLEKPLDGGVHSGFRNLRCLYLYDGSGNRGEKDLRGQPGYGGI